MSVHSVAPSNFLCVNIATVVALVPDNLTASGARVSLAETQALLLCVLSVSINAVQLNNSAVLVLSIVRYAVTSLLEAEMSTIRHHVLALSKDPADMLVYSVAPSNIVCVNIATTVALAPDYLTAGGARVGATLFQARVLSLLSIALKAVTEEDPSSLISSVAPNAVTIFLWAISL